MRSQDTWLDAHRQVVESLLNTLAAAEGRHYRGLSSVIDIAAIYARHPTVGSLPTVERIRGLNAGPDTIRPLLRLSAETLIAERTRALHEKLRRLESATRVVVSGVGLLSIADLRKRARYETHPERGAAIEEALTQAYDARFTGLWDELRAATHAAAESLGYRHYLDYVTDATGVDPSLLEKEAEDLLASTAELHHQLVGPLREWQWDVPFRVTHLLHRIRAGLDSGPDLHACLPALQRTVTNLGLTFGDRVHLDLEPRDTKARMPLCLPVRVPDEIWVSIQPQGGIEDCRALAHELGHALHFASTDPGLPVETRRMGDPALVEGWAMIWENLFLDRAWLATSFPSMEAALRRDTARRLLSVVRLQSVRLLYQLDIFRSAASLGALRERYGMLMAEHFGAQADCTDYLDAMLVGFVPAERLRSWAFASVVAAFLVAEYGPDWTREPRAGAWLARCFAAGQPASAEEAARGWCGQVPRLSDIGGALDHAARDD